MSGHPFDQQQQFLPAPAAGGHEMQPMSDGSTMEPTNLVPKSHLVECMCFGIGIDPRRRPISRTEEIVSEISLSRLRQIETHSSSGQKSHANNRWERPGVREWIRCRHSALLTLDDNAQVPENYNAHLSSSTLAVKLMKQLSNPNQPGRSLAVGLFCGLDGVGARQLSGPVAAMQWLTLQLLVRSTTDNLIMPWTPDDLRHLLVRDYTQDPHTGMEIMSRIFDIVLFDSPAQRILVVLDKASLMDGMSLVLQRLLTKIEVMHFTPDGKVLKVVVTNRSADQFQDLAEKMDSLKQMNVVWFA